MIDIIEELEKRIKEALLIAFPNTPSAIIDQIKVYPCKNKEDGDYCWNYNKTYQLMKAYDCMGDDK